MRFDLTDLRLFLLVVEAGSITHGATRANLALPSASARLRGMEEAIGLPLLERGRRGVQTTPAGDTLAHHARLVLRQIEHMRGELGDYAKGLKAQIRLWCNTAAMTEFLPARLAPFLAGRPNVDMMLQERPSVEIVQAVSTEAADIGIVSDAVDAGALQRFPFVIDRLVLVAPRDSASSPSHPNPSPRQRRVALRDVLGHDMVGLSHGSPLQDYLDRQALRAGRPFSFRARMGTFDGVCRLVEHGVGWGIVPESAARRCRRSMAIRMVRLGDDWATRRLALCCRDRTALPPHARALLDHLAGAAPGPVRR